MRPCARRMSETQHWCDRPPGQTTGSSIGSVRRAGATTPTGRSARRCRPGRMVVAARFRLIAQPVDAGLDKPTSRSARPPPGTYRVGIAMSIPARPPRHSAESPEPRRTTPAGAEGRAISCLQLLLLCSGDSHAEGNMCHPQNRSIKCLMLCQRRWTSVVDVRPSNFASPAFARKCRSAHHTVGCLRGPRRRGVGLMHGGLTLDSSSGGRWRSMAASG